MTDARGLVLPGFAVHGRAGWHAASSGPRPYAPLVPNAIAANVPLGSYATATIGFPEELIRALPRDGIVLVTEFYAEVAGGASLAQLGRPLQLEDFDRRELWEGQPNRSVPEYLLFGGVGESMVTVRVYLGRQDPTAETLDAAQKALDCLVLPVEGWSSVGST